MKTSRIKTIVIVILLLVNAFLLVLLFGRQNQQRVAYERSVAQLSLLLTNNGIAFDTSLLPGKVSFPAAELSHDANVEASFAHALLGDDTAARSTGGGSSVYESDYGSLQFRANGAIEGTLNLFVSNPIALCEGIFRSCDYEMDDTAYAHALAVSDSGSGTIRALRSVDGLSVFAAPLSLTFENNTLVAVSGSFLSNVSVLKPVHGMDSISALVRFLDYRNTNGLVCTEITSLSRGYLLQGSTASAKLVPAWHISTDISEYYVNSVTGEITRE